MNGMKKIILVLALIQMVPLACIAEAVLLSDEVTHAKAEVLEIITEGDELIPGTQTNEHFQTIRVKIVEGDEAGKVVTVENDFLSLEPGDVFYLMKRVRADDGVVLYSVSEPDRLPAVIFFVIAFVVLVFVFGGIQGVRGLLSLIGSLFLILYVLLPGILGGYSPITISLGVSALIIIVGSYITHGFNKTTSSAVVGMIATVTLTGFLAFWAVHWAKLSGFSSDEAVYLNFSTAGSIDFIGLLLGGILIGLLGVLYDVAIGQAISVEELHRIAPHVPRTTIYARAVRIGREHIGALVNTLAIAYVGVSLPLLLLYLHSVDGSLAFTINREIFATEIIRTMIGSIGLVLAVPITTAISTLMLIKKLKTASAGVIERERYALEQAEHTHHH